MNTVNGKNSYPVVGTLTQHFCAELTLLFAGTGYLKFETESLEGLVRIRQDGIDILAIISTDQNKGNFKKFIDELKLNYSFIGVWEIWNDDLSDMLIRYGFNKSKRIEPNGEVLKGMVWKKPLAK